MNCQRVKCLIGVHDELDVPTMRALQEHISSCETCRESWLAEGQFRLLMAHRPPPPTPTPARQGALLAVPQQDWRGLLWRLKLLRWGPPLAATAALVAGGAFVARELSTHGARAAVEPSPVVLSSPSNPLSDAIDRRSTAVARVELPSRPSEALNAAVPSEPAAEDTAPEPIAPRGDAAALEVATRPPTQDVVPEPNEFPGEPGGGNTEPTSPPARPTDTPVPTATEVPPPTTPPTWSLVLEAWSDLAGGDAECPGCDLVLDDRDRAATSRRPIGPALVEVHALSGAERTPVFEGYLLPEADGVARARVITTLPPPYEVTFLGALDGFALCPADAPVKSVHAGAWPDGHAPAVPFYIWAGCQPPTPTPTPGAFIPPLMPGPGPLVPGAGR